MRLKHHSHELKNQQLGKFPLFWDQGVGGSNPLSPTNFQADKPHFWVSVYSAVDDFVTVAPSLGTICNYSLLLLLELGVRSLNRIFGLPVVHEVAINLVSRADVQWSAIKIAALRVSIFDASSPAIGQSP